MIKEFQGNYRWLSNFAPVNIKLAGRSYASVEHAYMSAKSDAVWWKRYCSDINTTAGQVKRKSRDIKLKENWKDIKVDIMRECLVQKFNTISYKTWLEQTGDLYIQEGNTWGDTFWGVCLKTGKGSNYLGELIMEIRKENTKSNTLLRRVRNQIYKLKQLF